MTQHISPQQPSLIVESSPFPYGAAEPAVTVVRGKTVEAVHYASIAVVDSKGNVTHALGDAAMVTMARSSIKPFQAMPLVQTGAADRYKFTPEQLSICCGSHSGTDDHVRIVKWNLAAAGNLPEYLKCGCHRPIFMQQDESWPANGEDKDSLRHNCSGKHSGFLALARHLDVPVEDYLKPESQSQKLVKSAVSRMCDYPEDQMFLGTDGCSAPNFPLPIKNLALGFRRLANPIDQPEDTSAILRTIKAAMTSYPIMFSGLKRLDYALMCTFPGNIVCKGGAEALQAIGFTEPNIGIVVKVHDGGARAIGCIVVETLRQLGLILPSDDAPFLKSYWNPDVRNNAGLVTGSVEPVFTLRKVS